MLARIVDIELGRQFHAIIKSIVTYVYCSTRSQFLLINIAFYRLEIDLYLLCCVFTIELVLFKIGGF